MGASLSTRLSESNMELRKRIDAAATKVILESNFTDLTNLTNEKHCNRLVKKVANVFQQNKDTVDLELLRQKLYTQQNQNDNDSIEIEHAHAPEKHKLKMKTKTPRIQNVEKKCIQISKFYVLFAHLFSCIVSTIDPSFKIVSHTKEKTSTSNSKDEKESPSSPSTSLDFCSSRIDALVNGELNENSDGDFIVKPNVCKTNISKSGTPLHLVDLPGMKALQELYNDLNDGSEVYDARYLYTAFTGKDAPDHIRRIDQVPLKVYNKDEECKDQKNYGGSGGGGRGGGGGGGDETKEEAEKKEERRDKERREIEKERMFYYYNERDRKKNEEENARTGVYLKGIVGSLKERLFSEYVQHVKDMIQRAESNRSNLLGILSEMFVYTYGDGGSISGVIINPSLSYKHLQSLVARTRRIVIKLYTDCEEDYKNGLDIFFAMVQEKIILKLSVQEEVLKKQLEDVMYGPPERYIPESLLYQQQYFGPEEINKKQFVPPHFKSSVISIVKKQINDDSVFKLALPELNAWISEEIENATTLLDPNEVANEFLQVYDYGDDNEKSGVATISSPSATASPSRAAANPAVSPSRAPVASTSVVPSRSALPGPPISPSPKKIKLSRTYDIQPKNLLDVIDE
jgi:hypothetical protein